MKSATAARPENIKAYKQEAIGGASLPGCFIFRSITRVWPRQIDHGSGGMIVMDEHTAWSTSQYFMGFLKRSRAANVHLP